MSTFIITVLKLLGSILSGGLLFQAFVTRNHAKPITKIAGVIVSILTLLMFFIDIKAFGPSNQTDEIELLYWQSVEKHPSVETYSNYLEQYPDGKFATIARIQLALYTHSITEPNNQQPESTLHNLPVNTNAQTEYTLWQQAKKAPSLDNYRAYLTQYPNGYFAKQAKAHLTDFADIPTTFQDQTSIFIPKSSQAAPSTTAWQTIDHYQVQDGLVKDNKTGLMWMRCSLGQQWQKQTADCQGDALGYSWQQAMTIPKQFDFAGYRDWRIPSREELKTLVFCSSGQTVQLAVSRQLCDGNYTKPTIIKTVFPTTPATWFWSASLDENYGERTAWGINFNDGYDGWDFSYNANHIRLVRGKINHQ